MYEGVLAEIGMEMTKDNQVINKEIKIKQQAQQQMEEEEKDDMEARLAALRMWVTDTLA